MRIQLSELNRCSPSQFVAVCGSFFEHSPWVAERALGRRPFAGRSELHGALCAAVAAASAEEQLSLVRAHPDLVGRAAANGRLTTTSAGEQSAAGLDDLAPDDVRRFTDFNAAYRSKYGFPFVICARENRKASILAGFATRLNSAREAELRTALDEIAKIAWHRLVDAIEEG